MHPAQRVSLILFFCLTLLISGLGAAVPYTWKNVQIRGGGFVTGIVFSPAQSGLIYCRTDVGGAFRWEDASSTWAPLNHDLGRNDSQLLGVLSVAADPTNASKVYLACGQYTPAWANNAAVLRSSDQGATWSRTTLSIKLGGNENSRNNGERLQVDPNLASTLFLGTSLNGLWKSTDSAVTWTQVGGFAPTTTNWVALDKSTATTGNPTQGIYVGVNATTNNIYRSLDGGTTFALVAGQPTGLVPMRVALSGTNLYVTYSSVAGPNGATSGAVWRYNTGTGIWTNLAPPICPAAGQGGFAGISVDASNPLRIAVSTLDCWGGPDRIYVSSNGGSSWTIVSSSYSYAKAPYSSFSIPHWMGDLQIDPFNPNRAMFVTGYGIWGTTNFANAYAPSTVNWAFENVGLEETVPLDIISPPAGAPLVSAIGDIDGFKHDNIDISPPTGRLIPRYGTNRSIAFAELLPAKMARSYDSGNKGAYSLDGGASWTAFAANAAAGNGLGGWLAVSADGARIVQSPGGAGMYYSTNNGAAWTASAGLPAVNELRPIADRVNPLKFYTWDSLNGRVYTSVNGAANFTLSVSGLTSVPGYAAGDANLLAVFGREGDLWLTNWTNGLHHSTNSGASFSKLANVQEAYDIAVGLTKPAGTYPALYLLGRVAGVTGFFSSDDTGATWTRINDNLHQFGWINCMAGDPRVYGRLYIGTGGNGILYGEPGGTPTFTPTRSPTSSPSATPSETRTGTQSETLSATLSSSPTLSLLLTVTATPTATLSLAATMATSESPSFTQTFTPQGSVTFTPSVSETPSPAASATNTPVASVLSSLTPSLGPSRPGRPKPIKVLAVPNPQSGSGLSLAIELEADADNLSFELYTKGMTQVGRYERRGPFRAPWCSLVLPLDSRPDSGLYYLVVTGCKDGGECSESKVSRIFYLQ